MTSNATANTTPNTTANTAQRSKPNRFAQLTQNINKLPAPIATRLLSLFAQKTVKLLNTTNTRIVSWTPSHCQASLRNRKKVQNHIGSVHAAAQIMLCETATGLLLSLSLPEGVVQVVKSIETDFVKRAKGDLVAIATLTEEQQHFARSEPEGELVVPVKLYDEDENSPIDCKITWAWRKKRKA